MSNDSPIIYDSPFQPSFSAPGRPNYSEGEAQQMRGRMLASNYDIGVVGKVVGYHGYREAKGTVYALNVQWTQAPNGSRGNETVVAKCDMSKRFRELHGVHAKVAEREWIHHQLTNLKPSQAPAPKPTRSR